MTPQYSILIVDDEDRLRLSLSLILQKENYHVETAANAEEALDYLQHHEYDLMFLDLNLPGMSGIDLLGEVHKQFPQYARSYPYRVCRFGIVHSGCSPGSARLSDQAHRAGVDRHPGRGDFG